MALTSACQHIKAKAIATKLDAMLSKRINIYSPIYAAAVTLMLLLIFGNAHLSWFSMFGHMAMLLSWSYVLWFFVLFPISYLDIPRKFKILIGIMVSIVLVFGGFYIDPDVHYYRIHEEDILRYFWLIKSEWLGLIFLGAVTSFLAFKSSFRCDT